MNLKKMCSVVLGLFLLCSFVVADGTIYQLESLDVQLRVEGGFELGKESGSTFKTIDTELFLYPVQDFRQQVTSVNNEGSVQNGKSTYHWTGNDIQTETFGYTANLKTLNKRLQVHEKVLFPLHNIKGYEQYTLPTAKIDSNHPTIVAKAAELVNGETDLFKVVFTMASWIEDNVKYDLNELTTDKAQKASWVLENRQGVCDEMTSLFVAMARSQGIPARFVSGVSYTEQEQVVQTLGTQWAGHGWAEVYFPDIGWVGFDIPFNEYGYVDVTHLKLREGFDPDEPATTYSWVADGVTLKPLPLKTEVSITRKGSVVPEEIALEEEILAPAVGFGSYNLVKGVVKNTADYYVATTLQLAVPEEVKVEGRNKRKILLGPKEVKETTWVVRIPEDLQENYEYSFPMVLYSEKNTSVTDLFTVRKELKKYTQDEIAEVAVQDEDKSYSRKVGLECVHKGRVKMGNYMGVTCTIKNRGTLALENIRFCLGDVCEVTTVLPNTEKATEITVQGKIQGWNSLAVTAENGLVEKKSLVPYIVLDEPKIELTLAPPSELSLTNPAKFTMELKKESLAVPQNVSVILAGPGFENQWEIDALPEAQVLDLTLNDLPLTGKNEFTVRLIWKDDEGNEYNHEKSIIVKGKAQSFGERIKMMLNWMALLFS